MATLQADRAENDVGSLLGSHNVRFTPARRLVVRTLAEAGGPMTAGDLHERLKGDVPLSSLYRTLAVLGDARVLSREHDTAGIARYELAEWLTGHHHHLVCSSCGEVKDTAVDPETERTLSGLVERIAARAGYRVTGHRIDIEGRCRLCRAG